MTVWQALIQGIIQGLTEFLPVSSSGHLSLFQHFFGLNEQNALFFSVMLHVGTLVAVFAAFWRTIWGMIVEFFRMIGDIFRGKFKYSECNEARSMVIMVIVATLPLLAFYFVKDYVTALAEDGDIIVEGVCFLITGTMLFLATRRKQGTKTAVDMTVGDALLIGVAQGVASMPGISRSGATISTGMLRGYSREFMVSFSFILGIPAILASSGMELLDAVKTESIGDPLVLLVGMVVSAVVGFFAIKLIQWLMKTDRFRIFAYYTLLLGVVVIVAGVVEKL